MLPCAVLLAGCDPATAPGARPGLTINIAGPATDTVDAPARLVTLTVRDSAGAPVAAARLSFFTTDSSLGGVFVVGPTTEHPGGSAPAFTGADGTAAVHLSHSFHAGSAWLRVIAERGALVHAESVLVTTLPGRPATLAMPEDTTMYQGQVARWRVSIADRYHNPIAPGGRFRLEAATPGIVVSSDSVQAITGPSRQLVRARLGTMRDSSWLSIVPRGLLAAKIDRLGTPDAHFVWATMQLDGSSYRPLMLNSAREAFEIDEVSWLTDTELLADRTGRMHRLGIDGALSPLFPTRPGFYYNRPQVSADRSTVFFHRIQILDPAAIAYRASFSGDGTDTARISPAAAMSGLQDIYPSPSPDGMAVAVASNRGLSFPNYDVSIIDLATGTIRRLGVRGSAARWSPAGDWIAFGWDGRLFIIRPDGSGAREIGSQDPGFEPLVSWSSDGRWLIGARRDGLLELIEPLTGLRLPLGFTRGMRRPALR